MKAGILCRPGWHRTAYLEAMAAGLQRHGIETVYCDMRRNRVEGDFLVCWNWRNGQRYVKRMPVLLLEMGYLGDRDHWISVAWNGLNGRGKFPKCQDGGERFRKNFPDLMQPWKQGGEYIVVMGQVPTDSAVWMVDIHHWVRETAKKLKRIQDLPVFWRPHPLDVQNNQAPAFPEVLPIDGDLREVLDKAALVVTWNSNSGVDAVMAGVPAVSHDIGSMAWPVTTHSVEEEPIRPDRDEWAHRLAWCQWACDEMASGLTWEYVRVAL